MYEPSNGIKLLLRYAIWQYFRTWRVILLYVHAYLFKTVNEQNKQVEVVKVPSVENTKYLVKYNGM